MMDTLEPVSPGWRRHTALSNNKHTTLKPYTEPTSDLQRTPWTDSPLAEDCPQHSTTTNIQHSNPTANKPLTMDTLDRFSPWPKIAHSTLFNNRQTTLKPFTEPTRNIRQTQWMQSPLAEDVSQRCLQLGSDNTQSQTLLLRANTCW